MTELTEQEREEAFITLALSQKNAELYRRYGAMSPDELDKTGIPDLRRKMWEMTSRLIFAGLLDKECRVPFEKTPPDDYFSNRVVDGGPECGFKYGYVFSEFLVLRGGRTVCYNTISWHEAIKYLFKYNDIEPWKMDDEPMIVRFTAGKYGTRSIRAARSPPFSMPSRITFGATTRTWSPSEATKIRKDAPLSSRCTRPSTSRSPALAVSRSLFRPRTARASGWGSRPCP